MTTLTDQQITDALNATCGHVFLAAEKLGCDIEEIKDRIACNPRLAAIETSSRGRMVDTAEAVLHRAIIERESWAVRFALTSLGKDRGYSSLEDAEKLREQNLRDQRRVVNVQQVLAKVFENKDLLDYCRSKHRVDPPPQRCDPSESEPKDANAPSH